MFANIPTWTTERVELLKQHFEEGLSCREIAAIVGVSRNAVIGKLTRLGLTRGPGSTEPRATPAKPRAAKSGPRQQYQMLQVVYENGQLVGDGPVESQRPCSLFELSAAVPLADLDARRRGFLLLRQHAAGRCALLRRPL